MPLTENDLSRLKALGCTDFYDEVDGWITLRNVDGHCVFLGNNKCLVYSERPVGCTFYPAVYSMQEKGAILDHECPHRNQFATTETLDRDMKVLVDTIQRERRQRRFRK